MIKNLSTFSVGIARHAPAYCTPIPKKQLQIKEYALWKFQFLNVLAGQQDVIETNNPKT